MQYNGNLIISPDRDRAIFSALQRKLPGKIITPSYLRLEVLAQSGQSVYPFQIQKNVGNQSPTEVRLDLNDAFVGTKMGMYIFNDDLSLPGHAHLMTYPSPVQFPSEAGNVDPTHLECWYNGSIYLKVGNIVYSETIACRKFRVVPQTQEQVFVTPEPGTLAQNDSYDGLVDATPQFIFQGDEKTNLELHAPANATQKVQYITAATRIKIALYFEGYLIPQGSKLGEKLRD